MAANFVYSTRDLKFIIREWLDTAKVFAFDKYKNYYSVEDIDVIIDQVYKIAAEKLAPTNEEGDKIQARFENGKVTVPSSFRDVYRFLHSEGWGISNLDEEAEGTLPRVLYAALTELWTAANPAFITYVNLSGGASELIQSFAKEEYKKIFLPKMYAGEWSGTMCLTEAGAGSDVGDILTKAYPTDEPGIYRIKGSKIFITAGDHDICENIIHMVLARIEGAAPGTKGISLFIVPKIWVNPDGSLGEPNDVTTVAIEHKMGLKGSATAQLNFGENDKCRGILVGDPPGPDGVGQGMAQMFKMMNGARMDTGQYGYTTAAAAYFYAADYAKNRIQGRPYGSKDSQRVPIIKHADVKRMLMNLKSITEAMRAMAFKTYYYFDIARFHPDPAERQKAQDHIDVATPLVKAYCSDMAWQLTAEAIQVYGGYGFIEEYPVAQIARDCKIYSIWEGTNFIQSMDLVGRKWNLRKGEVFQNWLNEIEATLNQFVQAGVFPEEAALMQKAFNSYKNIRAMILDYDQKKPSMLPLYSTRILHATAQLYCGTLILDQAHLAKKKVDELGKDHWEFPFYQGKVDAARFYIKNVVPNIFNLEEILKIADDTALNVPEDALGA